MDNSAFLLALTGVVPAVCDAEAGETDRQPTNSPLNELDRNPVQLFAKTFKNFATVSSKLGSSNSHIHRGTRI
jgi:hypothetical protein